MDCPPFRMNRLSAKLIARIIVVRMIVKTMYMLVRGIVPSQPLPAKASPGVMRPEQVHGTATGGDGETFTREGKEPYMVSQRARISLTPHYEEGGVIMH